jgi:hypothetical protein
VKPVAISSSEKSKLEALMKTYIYASTGSVATGDTNIKIKMFYVFWNSANSTVLSANSLVSILFCYFIKLI